MRTQVAGSASRSASGDIQPCKLTKLWGRDWCGTTFGRVIAARYLIVETRTLLLLATAALASHFLLSRTVA